jgi:hypothetical protein
MAVNNLAQVPALAKPPLKGPGLRERFVQTPS